MIKKEDEIMLYKSTRSELNCSSAEAVLKGLAADGGLYIDPAIMNIEFDWEKCVKLSERDCAVMVLSTLLPDFEDMAGLVERAYSGKFDNECIAPLVPCGEDYVLELFHGPTSAFKDVALSMLPQLITSARNNLGMEQQVLILTATSGDTGKAALEGFHDVPGTGIVVFYPEGGVSPVQRAQMVCQQGANVKVCAVRGNFDDCQRGVKEAFAALSDESDSVHLSSANSINIGRLAPQVIYYFTAYSQLLERGEISLGDKLDFVVPTGNFGDILAGYYAKLMGLPVGRLVCASNANNVLYDFINTGVYDARRPFIRTSSPSMDILVSSNLERLLFLACGGDDEKVSAWMKALKEDGIYKVDEATLANIQAVFSAGYTDEKSSLETIGRIWNEEKYLCDPHTAVAFSVLEKLRKEGVCQNKCVVLSTASPYKFPAAVLSGIGGSGEGDEFDQMNELCAISSVPVPKNLSGLKEAKELHLDVIDKNELTDYVRAIIREGGLG